MNSWVARLRYGYRRHGSIGLLWLVAHNLALHLRRGQRHTVPPIDSFDQKYGTDTHEFRNISSLDVLHLSTSVHAIRYQPSDENHIRQSIEKASINEGEFTFIDFGSGKGKALLVASYFPFKEVIGVEFSKYLNDIAQDNIARFPKTLVRAVNIKSIHKDVTEFELPHSNILCYFFNPFGASILEPLVAQLIAHHRQHGFRVIVIYVDPEHREIFERTGEFTLIEDSSNIIILATQ